MSDSFAAMHRRSGTKDQELLDQLNDARSRLAKLAFNGPQNQTPAEHQQQILKLEQRLEQLEADVSRRSAGFYERTQPTTLAMVQRVVPEDAALIEFAVYRPFDPKAPDNPKAYGEPRYIAYIIRHQGEPQWQDLGSTKAIDEHIDSLRQALRDPQRKDVRALARGVDERIMQSIRAMAGNAKQLLISPDGNLNLLPFETLVDEQGHYLIERFTFTYLTSGRDLLRMQVARESKSKPLVVANPVFGDADRVPGTTAMAKSPPHRRRRGSTVRNLSDLYFAPLDGTDQEAQAIKALFPEAEVLTRQQATETALKQVTAPSILHIATHGFFLEDSELGFSGSGATNRGITVKERIENPLLRSGLALAGANLRKAGEDNGILTALEASGLNLWGTKLVVLSACDTGLGEVRNGEGVYGLRRALVLAGAETLVMSLWPVSDYVTRQIMVDYYKGLKQGEGRSEALRQVELAMLRRKDRQHPFYWASFIQSGEWANLNGKR
jgi:CHAT domain-containing protein